MDRVADHRIIAPLGRGTAGVAYLAAPAPRLGVEGPVVVKVLDRAVAEDELGPVADQLAVVAGLGEPGLVELYEVGRVGPRLFVVERFHPDGGLDRPEAHPEEVRLQAVADAGAGLHALHEVGLVHRGVTPGNVLVAGGRGVLAEPSVAALVAPGLTTTGSGTLLAVTYLEPEVVWGEPAGRATDIWALGVTLHQVLTGRSVFPGLEECSVAEAFRHILHHRPELAPELPPAAAEVIERCLAPRRTDRYATALDAARAVGALVATAGEAAQATERIGSDREAAGAGDGALQVVALAPDLRSVPPPPAGSPLPVEGAAPVGELDTPGVVVPGRRCARGHLNRPDAAACARCGIKLVAAADDLVEGLRPPLGVLTVDDGASVALVADLVVGREPTADELVADGRARPFRIADSGRTVSRAHALVRLVGWEVTVEDRASANGTFVRAGPQEPWRRVAAGAAETLQPGWSIRLGQRELTFELHER